MIYSALQMHINSLYLLTVKYITAILNMFEIFVALVSTLRIVAYFNTTKSKRSYSKIIYENRKIKNITDSY